MVVLGISALYHDSAACIVIDREIIAAAQQERFSRIKHDSDLPEDAIKFCLKQAGINAQEVDIVAFYDNSMLTLDRFVKNVLAAGEDSKNLIDLSFESIFTDKIWIHKRLQELLWNGEKKGKIVLLQHHISHAASAFYPSPYEEAVILTMDGVGEWATTTIGIGRGREIELLEEIRYPHSLGLFYSAFTYYCGFKVNSGDYKFMGLAPYGKPIYVDVIKENIIDIKEDGSFRLHLEYFDYQYGRTMINSKFEDLFGAPRRQPETLITQHEMDIAASAQAVIEEVILKMVRHAKESYGAHIDNLVLAGGVALNCVANGKIKDSGLFRNMWIQPAAGDAGGSLGSALYAYYHYSGDERKTDIYDTQKGSYLGPRYTMGEIEDFLKTFDYPYETLEEGALYERLAEELATGKVIGLFQGRMEFGPRALGSRSIIGDARSEDMQIKMNQKIKFRESFRPFAPSVLREDVSEYFELEDDSPYMLLVEKVKEDRRETVDIHEELHKHKGNMLQIVRQKRSDIPAVTHVDYSARIQTVTVEKNEYYYKLLKAFKEKTGCGVIVNTSFNVRGEPIVCSPKDAYDCFMRTDMDVLVLESAVLYKEKQPHWEETIDWQSRFELD